MHIMQHTFTHTIGMPGGGITAGADPLAYITRVLTHMQEGEQEATRRAYIRARRAELASAINAEKDLIVSYFDQCCAAHRDVLQQCYGLLHSSMARQDTCGIDAALSSILGMMLENPPRAFAEFRRTMARNNFVLEL
jgi:hypothetical protein